MTRQRPLNIILIGFFLVLFGFLGPLLMVIQVVEASFFLSFLSFIASVAGLFMGIVGTAWYSQVGKKD